jgi:cytochrome P450
LFQLARWIRGLTPLLEECSIRYGDVFTLRLPVFGTFVVFSASDDIRDILRAPASCYDNGGPYSFMAQAFGPESVQALTGEPHRRERTLISPHLHGERMRAWSGKIRAAVERNLQPVPRATPVPLLPIIENIAFETAAALAMSVPPGPRTRNLVGHLRRARHPMIDVLLRRLFSTRLPNPGRAEVLKTIETEIFERRSAPDPDVAREDMLEVFLRARTPDDEPMPDSQVQAEVLTTLIAGYSSVAAATAWAVTLILQDPPVREKIEAELAARGEADLTGNGFDYLDAAIKESLRIRPLVPMIFRRLAEPRQVGRHLFPAGVTLVPCIHLAHFRADYWADPTRFLPERFLGNVMADGNAWLPFGGGHRRCIGASFALMEMRIILATLLRGRSIQLDAQSAAGSAGSNRNRFTRAPSSKLRVLIG